MLTLKVVRGRPPATFSSMEEFTALTTTVVVYELKPRSELDKDIPPEQMHPEGAVVGLLFNGTGIHYLYPEDSAYLIGPTGDTVKTIYRNTRPNH